MVEVTIPNMGDPLENATLLKWRKRDCATVCPGDVIAEIEIDKSRVEIEAQSAGVLHLKADTGAVLLVGTVIAIIG